MFNNLFFKNSFLIKFDSIFFSIIFSDCYLIIIDLKYINRLWFLQNISLNFIIVFIFSFKVIFSIMIIERRIKMRILIDHK